MKNATLLSILRTGVSLLVLTLGGVACAATTDIATSPVVTSDTSTTPVAPNLMFIIDDSGSMDWDFLPDWSNDYYCKRANGSVKTSSSNDSYSVNSLCCRNRSGGSNTCMSGTTYADTGSSAARGDIPMNASDFNFAYYNPAITYTPPKNADGTSKTSQTCANSGGTVSGSTCTGGWATVKLDAYEVQEASTTTYNLVSNYPDVKWCTDTGYTNCRTNTNYFYPNQVYKYFYGSVGNPYYYTIIAGEYCDSEKLTNCTAASAPTGSYTFPAKLRWCSDVALTTCQGIKNATYIYPRYPTLMPSDTGSGSVTTVITVTGSSTASNNKPLVVNSITGGTTGPNIVSTATASTNDVDTAADRIIVNMASAYTPSAKTCSTSGTTRTCTITVLAPSSGTCPSGAITSSLTHGSGSTTMTVAATPAFTSCRTPGSFVRVDIVSSVNSYPYPNTTTKATDRTDCAGTTCTYLEEMTNFANWFTYYRTRMQMMKSASSLAFSGIDSAYRVGYMSINNNNSGTAVAGSSGDFLNISTFNTTQKANWYSKLFSAKPNNGTPLRSALSTAGLIYGGVVTGTTFNGSTVTDPVQYSCQKNFTILSTDGYWNTGNDSKCSGRSGAGCQLDTTTALGNADGVGSRPYSDGGVVTVTTVTPTVTQSVVTTPRTVVATGSRTSTATTVVKRTAAETYTRTRKTVSGTGCSGSQVKVRTRLYSGSGTSTETTTTKVAQPQTRTTTTVYSDAATTTTTSKVTIVTTNGIVTSDNTSSPVVTTTGPTTVTTTTSGPTTTAWGDIGGATTTVTGPTVTSTGSTMSGTAYSDNTSGCVASTSASDVTTGPVRGAWSGYSTTGPTTATGSTTTSSATTTGAASTVTTGPTVGTPTVTTTTAGGVSDTLADAAYYFYSTDLRAAGSINPDTNVDVGTGELDSSTGSYRDNIQRMSTYTLGLGIDGYMKFNSGYSTASSGDYYDVANGQTSSSSRCTWQTSGTTCNWPAPSSDSQANIDDLWHAAVNGRGTYFSARSPAELGSGLSSALSSISAKLGAAAAATTSNPNITSGDNFLFSSDFTTNEWTSKMVRLQIDTTSGNIITETDTSGQVVAQVDWNAQTLLDARVSDSTDSRTILTFNSDLATTTFCGSSYASYENLKPFCWSGSGSTYPSDTSLNATEQSYFATAAISSLPQFCTTGTYTITGDSTARNCLSASQQTDASGAKLVRFLRGQYSNENQTSVDATLRYYRDRTHVLGDIISSEAVYVKTPQVSYTDNDDFAAFKTSQAANSGMVYVAANDGMLHAFNASTGAEVWAFVPTPVLSKMFNLASMNYGNDHKFLLDGTPVVDYIYTGSAWKTVLVGGQAAGGAGYYALDITDPTYPKGLWEFKQKTSSCAASLAAAVGQTSDCDLGYSFGNPVITKLVDGTWVVLITSGYNNTTPGDGKGYLYVLDAQTGAIIKKLGTGVGSNSTITGVCSTAPCPSGLAKIAAWVDSPNTNNTAKRVYGGDLLGNLWRFDINDSIGVSGDDAQLLAILKGPAGALQPVTERPELGETNGIALVLVGTGKFLGDSDKSDTNQTGSNFQSFYAIKDPLTSTGWGDVRAAGLVRQTLTINSSDQSRTSSSNSVVLATVPGWYVDFPDASERSYTDPALALGTLVFTTNLPTGTACSSSGQSFIYYLDYRNGTAISGMAGTKLGNALATRPVVVQLEGGAVRTITRLSDTTTDVRDMPVGSAGTSARRVNWRQIFE